MNTNSRVFAFIPLLITYILVKIVHKLAGFEYDIFTEGVFTLKFVLDIASWVFIYGVVYFLFKKLSPQKNA
ncbi:hypothetical protein [uncultured Pontibacter sp.]|uniref:hypothetical protein n=1 Tax=uncultured Pontibacter sp. TaxID=453356 RepID=UPI00261016CA|nr:hypothetical protein [uncultured Pontibacter sp.]